MIFRLIEETQAAIREKEREAAELAAISDKTISVATQQPNTPVTVPSTTPHKPSTTRRTYIWTTLPTSKSVRSTLPTSAQSRALTYSWQRRWSERAAATTPSPVTRRRTYHWQNTQSYLHRITTDSPVSKKAYPWQIMQITTSNPIRKRTYDWQKSTNSIKKTTPSPARRSRRTYSWNRPTTPSPTRRATYSWQKPVEKVTIRRIKEPHLKPTTSRPYFRQRTTNKPRRSYRTTVDPYSWLVTSKTPQQPSTTLPYFLQGSPQPYPWETVPYRTYQRVVGPVTENPLPYFTDYDLPDYLRSDPSLLDRRTGSILDYFYIPPVRHLVSSNRYSLGPDYR